MKRDTREARKDASRWQSCAPKIEQFSRRCTHSMFGLFSHRCASLSLSFSLLLPLSPASESAVYFTLTKVLWPFVSFVKKSHASDRRAMCRSQISALPLFLSLIDIAFGVIYFTHTKYTLELNFNCHMWMQLPNDLCYTQYMTNVRAHRAQSFLTAPLPLLFNCDHSSPLHELSHGVHEHQCNQQSYKFVVSQITLKNCVWLWELLFAFTIAITIACAHTVTSNK